MKRNITNDEFKKDTIKLIKKLKDLKLKKKKTCIVAVSRGGLVPAQYVAYALGIREMTIVQAKLYDGEERGKTIDISGAIDIDYETYDNIIIVDDIYDSGITMQAILFAISEMSHAFDEDCRLIPACVYTQKKKEFMQDEDILYGSRIKKIKGESPWLVFPWDDLGE